jgi:hypothetical protein
MDGCEPPKLGINWAAAWKWHTGDLMLWALHTGGLGVLTEIWLGGF